MRFFLPVRRRDRRPPVPQNKRPGTLLLRAAPARLNGHKTPGHPATLPAEKVGRRLLNGRCFRATFFFTTKIDTHYRRKFFRIFIFFIFIEGGKFHFFRAALFTFHSTLRRILGAGKGGEENKNGKKNRKKVETILYYFNNISRRVAPRRRSHRLDKIFSRRRRGDGDRARWRKFQRTPTFRRADAGAAAKTKR